MIASHYGLHVSGGIPFLIEKIRTQNLISAQLYSPYELQVKPRHAPCPHHIDLKPWPEVDLPPLARAFLPIPRAAGQKAVWVHDPNQSLDVATLCRLSSPALQIPRPIWWREAGQLQRCYTITNLGPVVWTGAGIHQTERANHHIELGKALNRQVVIVSTDKLPLFDDVEQLDLCSLDASLPLEQIGAGFLHRHMTDIQNDGRQSL
jgi:hypothetical protein